MAKYRNKLPVEAHQLSDEDYPLWLSVLFARRRIKLAGDHFLVATREEFKPAGLGDWIVRDRNNDLEVVTADEFAATYEPVEGA